MRHESDCLDFEKFLEFTRGSRNDEWLEEVCSEFKMLWRPYVQGLYGDFAELEIEIFELFESKEETSLAYAIVKIVIPGDLQRCVETISIECLPSQALCLGNMEMNNAEIITRFDFIHAIVEATHEELKRRNRNDA